MILNIDFVEKYDEESLIKELRRLASLLQKETLTKADIDKAGRVSYAVIRKRFGSLRQALQAADLSPQRFTKATDAELFEVIIERWERVLEKKAVLRSGEI